MKLTESKLKQIIKEELQKVLVTEITDGLPDLNRFPRTDKSKETKSKVASAMEELFSPKEVKEAVGIAMKAIIDVAGVKSTKDFIRKYDNQHPLRKEFRQLYGLRSALNKGRKIDMRALLNSLETDSVLAAVLGVTGESRGFDVPRQGVPKGDNELNKMYARIRQNVEKKKQLADPAIEKEADPTPVP